MSKNQNGITVFLTEGVIIGIISFAGYLMSFLYESAYLSMFSVPSLFVEINLNQIIIAIICIALLFIVVANPIILLFYPAIVNRPSQLQLLLAKNLILLIIYILCILSSKNMATALIPIGTLYVVIVFMDFIFPLIVQRKKNYLETLDAQRKTDNNIFSIFDMLGRVFGTRISILFAILLVLASVMNPLGGIAAKMQTNFQTIHHGNEDYIIVSAYQDSFVGVVFDRKNNMLQKRYRLLKLSENSQQLVINNEEIKDIKFSK